MLPPHVFSFSIRLLSMLQEYILQDFSDKCLHDIVFNVRITNNGGFYRKSKILKSAPGTITKTFTQHLWKSSLGSMWFKSLGKKFYVDLLHVKKLLEKKLSDLA